jgi:hypothetical protein
MLNVYDLEGAQNIFVLDLRAITRPRASLDLIIRSLPLREERAFSKLNLIKHQQLNDNWSNGTSKTPFVLCSHFLQVSVVEQKQGEGFCSRRDCVKAESKPRSLAKRKIFAAMNDK